MNDKISEKIRTNKVGYNTYGKMHHEFRPYVMSTNADNFKSKIVNTDKFGFRKTYFKKKLIGLEEVKKNSSSHNVIIGGSTAFGMGSPSDKETIHSYLSKKKLCISLGARGAPGQQETVIYLQFKRFLGKVKNIIILSGLNDIALCAQKNSLFYPDFGGVMSENERVANLITQYNFYGMEKWKIGKNNIFLLMTIAANRSKIIRSIFSLFSNLFLSNSYQRLKKNLNLTFEKKISYLRKITSNDLDTWSMIAKKNKINIIYIFQPTIAWSNKKLTHNEQQIYQYEKNRMKKIFITDTFKKGIYLSQKSFLKKICKKNFIKFYDANEWTKKADPNKNFFIDQSHLTSYGNHFMSENINKVIN